VEPVVELFQASVRPRGRRIQGRGGFMSSAWCGRSWLYRWTN
jgi:hypothetical protein